MKIPLTAATLGLALLESARAFLTFDPSRRPPALVSSAGPSWSSSLLPSFTTQLEAKKRRRRKDADRGDGDASSSIEGSDDDLPDFDIADDNGEPAVAPKKKKTSAAAAVIGTTPEGETITAAMLGTPGSQKSKSVNDLIKDRSLEQKLSFEEVDNGEELPDLMQMARRDGAATGEPMVGKKKARQAQRQAAAAARQEEETSSLDSILKSIPFLLNEKGEVSGVKILEAGTWAGIFLLVGWEIYINSPFFERAAPIAPVVF